MSFPGKLRQRCVGATLAAFFGFWTGSVAAPGPDRDGDGIPDGTEAQLGIPADRAQGLMPVVDSPDRGYGDEDARRNAPDITAVSACHVGGQRLLFRIRFARPPRFSGAAFILYLDLDNDPGTGRVDKYHGGVDVMIHVAGDTVGTSFHNPAYRGKTTIKAALDGAVLWVAMDAPLKLRDGFVTLGMHLLSQRRGGRSDSTPHRTVALPAHPDMRVPAADFGVSGSLRPLSHYRYYDDKVKLERLEDKGLTAAQVVPPNPIVFGRERPPVPFVLRPRRGAAGGVSRRSIRVRLLETAGVSRPAAPLVFGVPLPLGELHDPGRMRALDPSGRALEAQFAATAFWPDGSLKWVRCDLVCDVPADGGGEITLEFGLDVSREPPPFPLRVTRRADGISVVTGPLRAVVDTQRFAPPGRIWVDRSGGGRFTDATLRFVAEPAGVVLLDEDGRPFSSSRLPPRRVDVEMAGDRVAILRIEGDYGDAGGRPYMSYIARLTFRAGSTEVRLDWTHVNSYTATEFTDVTSLVLGGRIPDPSGPSVLFLPSEGGGFAPVDGPTRVVQLDESTAALQPGADEALSAHVPGVVRLQGKTGAVGLLVHAFRERWPKGLALAGGRIGIELLPRLPGPEYGEGLPHYLKYPFVSGRYRFKWGMSLTERITFDFAGRRSPGELYAQAAHPVVAVIPPAWYAQTRALGPLSVPREKQFRLWDDFVDASFRGNRLRRERYREYGFFNYGDWYGERGRNWGNNEYDFAHGLFMQFARTGRADYFRAALAAARHQADVDIVHAYPDPFYVGANHQHSIGHTGTWTQTVKRATWSHRYDTHTDARNGHTWAEGMIDAWYLTGDPRIMEAALELGEHITWAMSKDFERLGTHERSAGWSLVAIMAIYRATGDPLYLEAARRIVAVVLREHQPGNGGAWPHPLPVDHAGGHRGARGNNLFLIGILLSGLAEYHAVTGDAKVEEVLLAGVRWVARSWDEEAAGWPYSAGVSGEPFYVPKSNINALIVYPVMYAARLTDNEKLARIVETALDAACRGGPDAFGKSLAQKLVFTSKTLALLQQGYDAHREDRGIHALDGSRTEAYLLRTPRARSFRVRGPTEKVFYAQRTSPAGRLLAVRTPHGARPKEAPTGTLTVFGPDGTVVARDEFSTDTKHEYRCELPGTVDGAVYKVVVRDDLRAVWDLGGEGLRIVARAGAGFSIGGVGRRRFSFLVPTGTRRFAVKLVGVHTGPYGAALITPGRRVAAVHEASNPGQVQLAWAPKVGAADSTARPERGTMVIEPSPEQSGRVWELVLWAAGDIACELSGIPPYLAKNPEACFLP